MKIEPFAEYGFNKSHAAAYAIIAYQTAYLKTHYPHQFFAASMSMELSNQKKLSEFYEELRRLKINIFRPDINKCFAEFFSDGNNFYYSLGALKNVGFEAISNIVKERLVNGHFKSMNDFILRVDPKDINKLQLEGLVKAGAFDNLNNNRNSIFKSIPNIILKSKNLSENKSTNQIDLFNDTEQISNEIIKDTEDWKLDEKLNKEFETLGFFISDHPLNQYKDIFYQYKIINYTDFENKLDVIEGNIVATILKVQEKKTQKGTSYAIVKFSDLSCIFELFIFSDLFELNRAIIQEGKSLMLTIYKNTQDKENRLKKINVRKITSLEEVVNKPIKEITLEIKNLNQIDYLKNFLKDEGTTKVRLNFRDKKNNYFFELNKNRKITRQNINELKNKEISAIID